MLLGLSQLGLEFLDLSSEAVDLILQVPMGHHEYCSGGNDQNENDIEKYRSDLSIGEWLSFHGLSIFLGDHIAIEAPQSP